MGKFKELWKRENDGPDRGWRSFVRYATAATFLCIVFLFVKKDNLVRLIQSGVKAARQEQVIEDYQRRNAELSRKKEVLTTDVDSLEKFARENYQFTRQGDDVYIAH